MQDDTKRELVSAGGGLIGSLIRDMLTHRTQMQQMEEKKEMELELAETRQEAEHGEPHPEPSTQPSAPRDEVADVSHAIQDLKAREDCGVCRDLLEAIEMADSSVQVKALTEYGRLKRALEAGASQEELREVIGSSETLEGLIQQESDV